LSQRSGSFESIATTVQLEKILETRENQEKVLKTSSWYQEIFPPGEKSKNQETPGKIRRFGSPALHIWYFPSSFFLPCFGIYPSRL
jgi:hypothetical protein